MSEALVLNRAQRREAKKAEKRKEKLPRNRLFNSAQDALAHLLKPIALLRDCRPYEEREINLDLVKIREAFIRLKDGSADTEDFRRVAVAINLAKVRAMDIDDILANAIEDAQDAMTRCKERFTKHGRYGFDGQGLQITEYAIDAHEEILKNSSPKLMEDAMFVLHDVVKKQTPHGQQLSILLLE